MSLIPRTLRAIALSAALVVPAVAISATPVSAASITCPVVYWGSLPKTAVAAGLSESIQNVRTGQHACFDRLVVDITGSGPVGYHVSYVAEVRTDGQGDVVPLAGGTKLQIVAHAPSYDIDTGLPTYDPSDPNHLTDVTGYRTFRQVADAGSFEGQTTFGLGVRALLPMRVFVLSGPGTGQRLVVDVAHRWGSF